MTRRMMLLALVSVMMLIIAACEETTPERVDDSGDGDTTDVSAEEASDDDIAAEEESEGDDAGEAAADEPATDEENTTEEEPEADDADEAADEETSDDTDAEVQATDDEAGDDAELEEAEGFTVGDTVRMGDLVMMLHAVRWDDGGEFTGPDEGMRWLVVDIEIENEADSSSSISSLLMFDLVDQENRSRDIAFMADTEGSVDGELGAGRSMRGDIAWEVREEQTEWELIFSPELFGFGQAIFDIGAGDF